MYTILEPEVAGGFGDATVLDSSTHPPTIHTLEYCFDGWLGDDLLESFPVFIVTQQLQQAIATAQLTGYAFDDVIVTTSDTFDELYPGRELPPFAWLKVHGQAGRDDFGLAADQRLVVSEQAYAVLRQFQLDNCLTHPFG